MISTSEILSKRNESRATTVSKFGIGATVLLAIASAFWHVPQREAEHQKLVVVEKKEIPALKKKVATEKKEADDAKFAVKVLATEINNTQPRNEDDPPPVPKPKPKPRPQ